jgi:hypothetical protein
MKALIPVLFAFGCAHTPMTNAQFARSSAAVGAAVLITSAVVYAEYRSSSAPELSGPSAVALPPK